MLTTIALDALHAVTGGAGNDTSCPQPPPSVVVNPNCWAFCTANVDSNNTKIRGDNNNNGSQNQATGVAMPGSH